MKIVGFPSPPRPAQPHARRGSAGFTLLEVLVAVVVLSFGLLGVVGLQAAALQANKDARYQSSAARLSRELGDMMRGNNVVATYAGAANPYLVSQVSGPPSPAFPQNCYTNGPCGTPTLIAQFEMGDWLERVKEELPGAVVSVCLDATPYDATGRAQWACTGTGGVVYVKIGWSRQLFNPTLAASAAMDLATRPSIVQAVVPI